MHTCITPEEDGADCAFYRQACLETFRKWSDFL